ncbi:MAG: hypothetical protein MMC23_000168 [Stictis urceolatum]|nr:hypothetical protein [Stictis urceolata]
MGLGSLSCTGEALELLFVQAFEANVAFSRATWKWQCDKLMENAIAINKVFYKFDMGAPDLLGEEAINAIVEKREEKPGMGTMKTTEFLYLKEQTRLKGFLYQLWYLHRMGNVDGGYFWAYIDALSSLNAYRLYRFASWAIYGFDGRKKTQFDLMPEQEWLDLRSILRHGGLSKLDESDPSCSWFSEKPDFYDYLVVFDGFRWFSGGSRGKVRRNRRALPLTGSNLH